MRDKILLIKILALVMVFAFSACQKSAAENVNITSLPVITPTANPTPSPNLNSPIRKVDFENFKYLWVYMNESGMGFFELKSGEKKKTEEEAGANLQKIEYGDVTNDGEEEAIISIYPNTGGNCSCDMVYIYASNNEKAKLLWGFGTGDRAEGGLKKIYAENGELVVELFGDNKFENDKWEYDIAEGKFNGLCCPTTFTKFRFKWNGEKFIVDGKPELFDYDWKSQKEKNRKT